MEATVYFNGPRQVVIKGETIADLIVNNFDVFKEQIRSVAGNEAGFTLDRLWITRKDDKVCELHAMAHGDDSLIGYDPTKEEIKEVIIEIENIPVEEFDGIYEYELGEREFSPFNEIFWKGNKVAVVGILEMCIDYVSSGCNLYGDWHDMPSKVINTCYLTLKDNNLPKYTDLLLKTFEKKRIRRNSKNAAILDLIEKLKNELYRIMNEKPKRVGGQEFLYRYKTMDYFNKEGKITALRYYREKSDKTQSEMAEEVGISLRQYQRYESVDSSLHLAKGVIIDKIAEVVGVTMSDLIDHGTVKLIKQEQSKEE